MAEFDTPTTLSVSTPAPLRAQAMLGKTIPRLKSRDLLNQTREVEIDHEGRIYRLRITQLNKLILTA